MLYMVTFTINIPPMLAYIPYMDPMGIILFTRELLDTKLCCNTVTKNLPRDHLKGTRWDPSNGSSVYYGVSIWNVNICEHHLELEHVPLFSVAMVVY